MKNKLTIWIRQTVFLAIGSALCAFSVKAILVPQGFISTGLTGAALAIYYRYPVASVEMLYLMINIPLFLLGWRFVGTRFILYSFWGMLIYSLMLRLVTIELRIADPMLCAILSGAVSGLGIGVILRSYGSTGGSEILCVMMHKLFSFSIGTGSGIINSVVLTAAAFMFPIEKVLYALVYAVVNMAAINKFFYGPVRRKAALIISDKWPEIVDVLTGEHHLGVTKIDGTGGYRGDRKTILYSVIRQRNIAALKKAVLKEDPCAFIALMTAEDVTGLRVGNQPHW